MAQLNQETIKNLARLCRIDCNEEESISLQKDLQQILDYVEELQKIDTDKVEPCDHVLAYMINVMREDTPGPTLSRKKFLDNAPAHVGGMIRVPSIIK